MDCVPILVALNWRRYKGDSRGMHGSTRFFLAHAACDVQQCDLLPEGCAVSSAGHELDATCVWLFDDPFEGSCATLSIAWLWPDASVNANGVQGRMKQSA